MIIILNIFLSNFRGITLFPFIIVKDKKTRDNKTVINHERIHLRQQIEIFITSIILLILLKILFGVGSIWSILGYGYLSYYILYIGEWIINKIKKRSNAYRSSSFEKEAYSNDDNLDYLKTRKWYSSFKYLKA